VKVTLLRRSRVLAAVVAVERSGTRLAFETLFPIRLGEVLGAPPAAVDGTGDSGAWFAAAAGAV
jgi:hypothetical protein